MYFKLLLPPLISDLIYPVPRHALFTCIIWDVAIAASLIRLYRSPARGHDTRAYVSRMKNLHVHVDPNRPVAKFPFCTGGAVLDIGITSPLTLRLGRGGR